VFLTTRRTRSWSRLWNTTGRWYRQSLQSTILKWQPWIPHLQPLPQPLAWGHNLHPCTQPPTCHIATCIPLAPVHRHPSPPPSSHPAPTPLQSAALLYRARWPLELSTMPLLLLHSCHSCSSSSSSSHSPRPSRLSHNHSPNSHRHPAAPRRKTKCTRAHRHCITPPWPGK
jgi:hypothetical protein